MPTPKDEQPSDREKSEYRFLYVGQDVDWFRRLKGALGLPANRLVYCGRWQRRRLLEERYSL